MKEYFDKTFCPHIGSINDLCNFQKDYWRRENEYFFGITPISNWNDSEMINKKLAESCDKFWNNGTNQFKELLENGKCNDIDKMIPGTWELVYDVTGLVCLFASFKYEKEIKGKTEKEELTRRSPIAYLPCPDDLCWYLNDTRYVLRITATANYGLIRRVGRKVMYQKTWIYDLDTKEFTVNLEDFDPYDNLTEMNRDFLAHWVNVKKDELTRDLFIKALTMLPEYDAYAIYNFRFTHVDEMFKLVQVSKRFANPLTKVPVTINVVKMFTANRVRNDARDINGSNNLVLASNEIFALENSRTVIYKNEFNSSFMFTNSERFFDAFKTSTNKSAGKSRLILDGVEVYDGKLWVPIESVTGRIEKKDMYSLQIHPEWKVKKNLSVLSSSNFSSNNAPKRIMMTAKLRAQAVPTAGELDPFTHETPARIVFGDWKGFNFGDGIIISRSFARKLRSHKSRKIQLNLENYKYISEKYSVGDYMSIADLSELMGSTMCNNFRNIKITGLEQRYLSVEADVPFSVGDKITNMHGSKGIVSLILEDKDMPYIDHKVGNLEPGPFDVIVSGMSVYRRKSLGQLFEAWAKATGHDDVDNVIDAVTQYSDDMKQFSKESIVIFGETSSIKPIGINVMIRLDHDSVGKQSHSYLKSNYGRMLKFGEMELLNLAARGLWDIMNEIDIRSISKHQNALVQIRNAQKSGFLKNEAANNLRFFNILRMCGFEFNLRNPKNIESGQEMVSKLKVMTDKKIDIFREDGEE